MGLLILIVVAGVIAGFSLNMAALVGITLLTFGVGAGIFVYYRKRELEGLIGMAAAGCIFYFNLAMWFVALCVRLDQIAPFFRQFLRQ